jgi:O-antigen/teichoic acid export membrane protein
MKDRIAKSVFWIGWVKGLIQILAFLSTLYVARLLHPNDYGLLALTGIWIGSLALLIEMGLGAAVVQFRALDERELNICFWLTLGVASAAYWALYVAAPLIAAWFATPMLTEVLRVVSFILPLTAVRIVPDGLLRKSLSLDRVSQAEILSVVVTIPVQVGMASAGAGVWTLVTGMLLMAFVQSLVTFFFSGWWPGLRMGSGRLKAILSFSSAKLGNNLCWVVFDQMDTLVVGKISGEFALGFYSMAKQIALVPVNKIAVVANQLGIPLMAELQASREQMRSAFLHQLRLVACLTTPLCIGLALTAEDLVLVALTEKWLPLVPTLQVLCLCAVVRSLEVLLAPVLLARYRALFLFWWTAGVLLVMPFAFLAGAAWLGGLGVALVWAAAYPFFIAWMAQEALRELNESWATIWVEIWPIVRATLIMGACVVLLRSAIPAIDSTSRLFRLVVTSGAGAFVYAAIVLWQGGPVVSEIVQVVRWMLGGFRAKSAQRQTEKG